MIPTLSLRKPFVFASLAACLAGAAGCATHQPDELAKAVYEGEKPVSMRGSDTFFNGQVAAIVTISRGIGRGYVSAGKRGTARRATADAGELGTDGPPEQTNTDMNALPNHVGGPSMNDTYPGGSSNPMNPGQSAMPGSGMPGSGIPGQTGVPGQVNPVMGGGPPQGTQDMGPTEMDEDAAREEQETAMAYMKAKAEIGSPMPPVTLRIYLRNLSGQTTAVSIDTFNSDLGNFAIEPETLTLLPRQLAEPTPMISQLGVTSDVIPVKVALKKDGHTEVKTILVRNIVDEGETSGN